MTSILISCFSYVKLSCFDPIPISINMFTFITGILLVITYLSREWMFWGDLNCLISPICSYVKNVSFIISTISIKYFLGSFFCQDKIINSNIFYISVLPICHYNFFLWPKTIGWIIELSEMRSMAPFPELSMLPCRS